MLAHVLVTVSHGKGVEAAGVQRSWLPAPVRTKRTVKHGAQLPSSFYLVQDCAPDPGMICILIERILSPTQPNQDRPPWHAPSLSP